MAHRFVITAILTGSRILGRSFLAAYRQAQASSQYQRAQAKAGGGSGAAASLSAGMTLEEACKVLNIKQPTNGVGNIDEMLDRFKYLFDANDPSKGGSFYLQSKIVRAKERIDRELGPYKRALQEQADIKQRLKIYK